MTRKEKAEADLQELKKLEGMVVRDYSRYDNLILAKEDDKVRFKVGSTSILYLTMDMFAFHLIEGIKNAKLKFLQDDNTADYQAALQFEQQAIGEDRIVIQYDERREKTVVYLENGYNQSFTNGTLIKYMAWNAVVNGREKLEEIINEEEAIL
jgi:hypothetical protein